jgi:lipoate-protein ligase B
VSFPRRRESAHVGHSHHEPDPHLRGDDSANFDNSAKIAAFGVRVRRWVAFHGLALNVNPDLEHFTRIKPCGLNKPITSLHALGVQVSMEQVAAQLVANLHKKIPPA